MTDITAAALPPSSSPAPAAPTSSSAGVKLWSGPSFKGILKDVLDTVNPLQHLPLIGSVYRYLTGDEPSGGARIAGDTLYGGPIGFGVSIVSTMLLDKQGHDLGERTLAAVFGPRDGGSDSAVMTAAAADTKSASTQPAANNAGAAAPPPSPIAAASPSQALPLQPSQLQTQLLTNLYRSPPPAAPVTTTPTAPATPEQTFLNQNAQFQHQFAYTRNSSGTNLNNRGVPLELSSNLLPVSRPPMAVPPRNPALITPASPAPPSASPALSNTSPAEPTTNPIAQKMIDALNKYDQLKKQQEIQDDGAGAATPKVDFSL